MTTTDHLIDLPESPVPVIPEKPRRSIWKIILYSFLSLIGFVAFVAASLYFLFYVIPTGPEIAMAHGLGKVEIINRDNIQFDAGKAQRDLALLEKKIEKLTTQGPYLIVNTTDNRFYLYNGKELIREGRCSTGKDTRLIDGKKEWLFKTPRGVHKVKGKQKNPVWAKPNWAFIEEGRPIPPAGDESRFDSSTLGDYKLDIGDGYMVHGTIWKRMMGLKVTHGCVRLLDDDLEAVYNTLPIGSKVIIY